MSEFFSDKSNLHKGKVDQEKRDQSESATIRRMHLQTMSEIERKENNETSAPLNIQEELGVKKSLRETIIVEIGNIHNDSLELIESDIELPS